MRRMAALLAVVGCGSGNGGAQDAAVPDVAVSDVVMTDAADAGSDGPVGPTCTPDSGVVDLSTTESGPWAVIVRDGFAYWIDNEVMGGTLKMRAITGTGPRQTLVSNLNAPNGLTSDAQFVYYGTADGTIGRVPLGGGSSTSIATGLAPVSALTVDATSIYFTSGQDPPNGAVYRLPIAGGMATQLATNEANPIGVVLDSARQVLYFLNGGSSTMNFADGALRKVPADGSAKATTVVGAQGNPTGIVMDSAHVYFTALTDGTVTAVPLDGSPATVIATGEQAPGAMGTDGTFLYWTAVASQTVRRMLPMADAGATAVVTGQSLFGLGVDPSFVAWTGVVDGTVRGTCLVP